MQNGIDSAERLAPILGEGVVCAAPARISAVITGPGTIAHKGNFANFSCGFMDGRDDARLRSLVDEMKQAKVQANFSTEIEKNLWEKFIFLDAMSGATASTRSSIGPVIADSDTAELLHALMKEVEAVGLAQHVPLAGAADRAFAAAKALPAGIKASMCEDVERGNRLELDWLQGKVVELGKKQGIATPANEYVYKVLKLLRNGRSA
jgi:2-dehydropantoate 2-reductase